MKKIIILFLGLVFPLLVVVPVGAVDTLDNEYVCQRRPESAVCRDNAASNTGNPVFGSDGIIATIFTWLLRITGTVSVIMLVIGGFKYVLSAGESAGVQSAKNTIIYALVGLIISGTAGLLLSFVLNRLG